MARDTEFRPPYRTLVQPSLTAELLFAANLAASEGERPGAPPGWAEAQRDALPPQVRETLPRFSGFWWPTMGLIDFFCHNQQFHDPEAFLADLARRPLEEFLVILFNCDLSRAEVAALVDRPEGVDAIQDRLSRFSQGTREAHLALFRDPEGHRDALFELVRASETDLFRQAFDQLVADSRSTVQLLEKRLLTETPLELTSDLWGRPLHSPTGDPVNHYIFVPSLLIGHPRIQCWGSDAAVFFLQEGGNALAAPTPEGRELADFLKVLGDPTRMDILRLLCCRPSFGKEIAERLHLTTATVSRHLDQLKAVGLVREDRADTNNVKRLRYVPETLEGQWAQLRAYLLHP